MALVVASNLFVFTFFPKPMKAWEWLIIGMVLCLILLQAHLLFLGPGGAFASYALPFSTPKGIHKTL